jgi:Dual-action HEIGH metallo-peptidase
MKVPDQALNSRSSRPTSSPVRPKSAIKGELALQECIAIGLGTRDRLRVERATGTGTVLHDHRLLERGIELLSEHARDDVHRPAGRERHDQLDRRTFTELGSGFRLGAVSRMVRPIPEEALQRLSTQVVGRGGWVADFPPELSNLPGDLTIMLAASEFVSFSSPFNHNSKKVIGIRGASFPPMSFPNVARNVIAHELGHAIGLRHNSDPTMLMCGRPSTCRPGLFRSDQPRMFPLRSDEKSFLLTMYPSQWKSR